MRLNIRMLIYVLATSVLIFTAGIGYISYRYKVKASKDAKTITDAYAQDYANVIKAEIDKEFGVSRGMAEAMLVIEDAKFRDKEKLQIEIMKKVLYANSGYIAAFLQWDLADCMPGYTKKHGRRRYFAYRKFPTPKITGQVDSKDFGHIDVLTGIVDTVDYNPENPYYVVKENLTEFIIDPYFYTYDNIQAMPSDVPENERSILETTIIVPIINQGRFRAITGVDIPLNHFNDIIKDIKPFDNSYAFIVANNGVIVAHPDLKLIGDTITKYLDSTINYSSLLDKISNGTTFTFTQHLEEKGTIYYSVAPIPIGKTDTPWALGIRVPMDVMMADANRHFYTSILAGVIGLIILSLIIWQISLNITKPIKAATELFKDLAQGKIENLKELSINRRDEIAEMANSANKLLTGFKHTSTFAQKVGEGDLDTEYKLLSKEDMLGKSLVDMRDKLKKSKLDLEESNRELEKLSTVAQKTDNAVLIMDGKGNCEWVNEAFVRMYGYDLIDLKENLGGNITEFSNYPKINESVNTCIDEKKSVFYNSFIKSKSGSEVYAQTTLSPVIAENGEVVRLVAIDSNITNIKQAQEEIKAQRDQVEVQRNQLQQLNATKDKFFSILAHDLKNPFSSLHSMSEMLLQNYEGFEDEDKFELTKKIHNSSSNIFELLQDLLTWSRLQRGQMEYQPVKFNISQLVEINLNINKIVADKKQIKLVTELPENLCAYGDREMVNTVIRNLINNAVKFTNKGGKITVKVQNNSNDMLKLSVIDTGIGISKEDLEKLFRIDIKTKTIGKSKEKGTGLGLILCKEFVEKNGGEIWVESEEGKGSCFTFTIKQG